MGSYQIVMNLDEKPTRRRRQHTRSRTGCLTCKQRRVRCDEQHPQCTNCIIGSRECKYATLGLPLRERRTRGVDVPGVQLPWQVARQLGNTAHDDPFDCLPIKMPLKSKELFHYFAHTREFVSASDEFIAGDRKRDCLAMSVQEPSALRSAMLIAGLHYSWQKGSLQDFESTYLYHKGECIRLVNNWVNDFDTRATADCMQLISTLVLAESFSGDLRTAEAHCDGLMTILDVKEAEEGIVLVGSEDDNEILERYILMAHNFVAGIKGLLTQAKLPNRPLLGQWQGLASVGRDARLKSLRLIPYFFGSVDTHEHLKPRNRNINGESLLKILRDITMKASGGNLTPIWATPGPASLLLENTKAHVLSLRPQPQGSSPDVQQEEGILTSWCGLAIATEFYLHSVIGMWYGGFPLEPRLFRRLFLILKRDVTRTEEEMIAGHTNRNLWFWKVFTGAYTLAKALSDTKSLQEPLYGNTLQIFGFWFNQKIRAWSKTVNVDEWDRAKEALIAIAWPRNAPVDNLLAASVWTAALSSSGEEVAGLENELGEVDEEHL